METYPDMLKQRIGFIGAGQMALALAKGFVGAGLTSGDKLIASDPSAVARDRFAEATDAKTSTDNSEVVDIADVIFLAVKPHHIKAVAAEIASKVDSQKLIVSIAAGARLSVLTKVIGDNARIVRIMPNTPCLIGEGACGYCLSEKATEEDDKLVEQMLRAVGISFKVNENLMDAITGLSGSGPAYAFQIIEALSDGGVKMGLPRNVATVLAAQTLKGASEMVLRLKEHPSVLKDKIASPGGTTIAGLHALESAGHRGALITAIQAATEKSIELGKKN